jgi:hypothetical protein
MRRVQVVWWLGAVLFLPLLAALANAAASGLAVDATAINLAVGQEIKVQVHNRSGKLKVSSSDPKVAKAEASDDRLEIKGRSAGVAILTLRDKKTSLALQVTVGDPAVQPPPTPTPAPAALSATPSSLALVVGQKATVQIANASGKLNVTVGNTDIARAKLEGSQLNVSARKAGSTQITVRDSKYAVVVDVTVSATGTPPTAGGSFTLLAWNDLGMHCMDGDFSVFSILPPYNNLHAQLVDSGSNKVVTEGVTLTYEAVADEDGSINSSSANKTNFWQYAAAFFGVNLPDNVGLTGNQAPSATPRTMAYNAGKQQFEAEGIPITPYDDSLARNPYPMVKVVAKIASGQAIAQARVVLPVSDEMSCANCHASTSGPAARPAAGWISDPNKEVEWKKNILRLHDEKHLAHSTFQNALAAKGYSSAGLLATANGGKPVLCAACHASNALPGTGVAGIKPLTEAIHGHHALVNDPGTNVPLDSINNRGSCYQCHPGSETKCLRGVMGNAVDADGKATMDCQACHGTMSNVGRAGRVGWLDQPNCQACHHDGKRETAAVSSTGLLKKWLDDRYASNPDTPAAGFSLFRMSKGHGGLQCEACHGATHAEYPSSHRNDNVLSRDVQGREGSIGECAACHKTVPVTANGGPHGMHTIGSTWVSKHEGYAERNASACAYCHGADYRGGPLARVKVAKSFRAEGRTVNYAAGQQVGCYDCHNGPRGD